MGSLSVGLGSEAVSGPGAVKSPGGLVSQSFQTRDGSAEAGAMTKRRSRAGFMGERFKDLTTEAQRSQREAAKRRELDSPPVPSPCPLCLCGDINSIISTSVFASEKVIGNSLEGDGLFAEGLECRVRPAGETVSLGTRT